MEELKGNMVPWAYGPAPAAEIADGGEAAAAVTDGSTQKG